MTVVVRAYKGEDDLKVIKTLFTAYHLSLPIDISYQNYQDEFNNLPGKYSTNNQGALLVAEQTTPFKISNEQSLNDLQSIVVGCVALRKMDETTCELKRLYVMPTARGLSVGQQLVKAIIEEAEKLQYHRILLDTLPTMTSAIRLYEGAGFKRIPKYYETPIEETVFLEKKLRI